MLMSFLSLLHAAIRPEWYTSLELAISLVALVTYELMLGLRQGVATKEQIEDLYKMHQESKAQTEAIANQLKATITKLSTTRMKIGLTD